MEDISKLLEALSKIIWPLLFFVLVFYFRKEIREKFSNIKSFEAGNIKIVLSKNNEESESSLASDDFAQLLNREIEFIQHDVNELRKKVISTKTEELQIHKLSDTDSNSRLILWVDDMPKNNAFMIARLENRGYIIDYAGSTAEGIEKFEKKRKPYRFIISDLGRIEENGYQETAGIDLLKAIKVRQSDVLFAVYSWSDKLQSNREVIEKLDGIPITSTIQLQAFFDQFAPPIKPPTWKS